MFVRMYVWNRQLLLTHARTRQHTHTTNHPAARAANDTAARGKMCMCVCARAYINTHSK